MTKDIIVAIIGAISTILAAYVGNKVKTAPAAVQGLVPLKPWYQRPSTFFVATLVLIILLTGILFGAAEQKRHEALERAAAASKIVDSYQKLVEKGIGTKAYILPSVLMLITLEKTADGKHINSDRRSFYLVQSLQDIKTGSGSFQEEYHSGWPIEQIAGSDSELITEGFESGKVGFNVDFSASKGERHTILTGAHTVMPFDLRFPRPAVHMYADLGPHDDAFCYPNDSNDIIEELVIVVQSTSLKLGVPGYPNKDAAESDNNGNNVKYYQPEVFPALASTNHNPTIVARFHDVQAGEIVGIHVSWESSAEDKASDDTEKRS